MFLNWVRSLVRRSTNRRTRRAQGPHGQGAPALNRSLRTSDHQLEDRTTPATVTVSFPTPSATFGEADGLNSVSVQFVTDAALVGDVTIPITVAGTATDGKDFTFTTSVTLLAADATKADTFTKTFDVTILNDQRVENTKEVAVFGFGAPIAPGDTVNLVAGDFTYSITDDDKAAIIVGAGPFSVNEGLSTLVPVTLDLTVTGTGLIELAVPISVALPANADFDGSTKVTFAAGAEDGDALNILVTGIDDRRFEAATEKFENQGLTITSDASVTAPGKTTIEVADNETATFAFNALSSAVGETDANFNQPVAVDLAIGSTGTGTIGLDIPVSVDVTDAGTGTATSGADYAAIAKTTFTFAAVDGSAFSQNATVGVIGDTIVEPDETILLNLVSPSAPAKLGATDTHTLTLQDNDTTTLTITPVSQNEDLGGQTFKVTLSNAVQGGLKVTVFSTDDTATSGDNDYTPNTQQLVFVGTANESQNFIVAVTPDNRVELDEQFLVSQKDLVLPLGILAGKVDITNTAKGTIQNDDTAQFKIVGESKNEGTPITFTVTLTNPVDFETKVSVASSDGTATVAENDYTKLSLTELVFAPGEVSKTVAIATNADGIVEPDQDFFVSLSNLVNDGGRAVSIAPAPDDKAKGVIVNTDMAKVSIAGMTVDENAGTVTFTIAISSKVDMDVTMDFTTLANTTTADADYTTTAKAITFLANTDTAQLVTVPIFDDQIVEGSEQLLGQLSNLKVGGVAPTTVMFTSGGASESASSTITDNDSITLQFTKAATDTLEDNTTFTVLVNVVLNTIGAGPQSIERAVSVRVSDAATGTATGGTGAFVVDRDYTYEPQDIVIAAGTAGPIADRPVTITVHEDFPNEGDETAILNLSILADATGVAKIGAANTHTINIVNDDAVSRTYDATVAGNYRLVRNGANVELFLGNQLVSRDALGATALVLNGTAGDDTFTVDFSGGDPIPDGGLTFDGKGGSNTVTAVNGKFDTITNTYTTSGNINFVGTGVVNYTNVAQLNLTVTSVGTLIHQLPATASIATLADDGTVGNGLSKLTEAANGFTPTLFTNPTTLLNILRGNTSDTLTIQAIPDLTSSLSVGTTANPFDATTVAGTINLNGSLTLNAKTIAVNAPTTTATAVTLVAVNTATQTAAIQTPTLNLGGAGNAGIYTLTNAGNDADSLTAGAAAVSYTDVDDLNLAGIGVATLTLNTGLLTDSAPTSVTGTTQLNAGTVTLDDAANDFTTLGITSSDSVTIVESNPVTLSTVTIARNFTLTAGGDVTDDATVTVGELATLKAANITLDSATNDFANVTVPAVGNLILVDANNVILLDTTATGAVLVKAGATLTVPAGKTISGNTLEFQVDTLAAANGTGGTANLVGANLIAPAGAKLNGGPDADTFNISKYTAALTVNGNDPTTFPGDRLFANGEGVNGLSQPVPGQLSLGGGLVTFTNIEQLIPVNTPTIALVGSTGDDTAIVNTNAAGKVVSYQLTLNGVAFPLVDVTTSNLLSFTFDGLDGNDTMIVNLATGLTSLTTAITFLGNSNTLAGDAGDKLAVVGTNQVATVLATPTATDAGAGTVTVGASAITYKGLEGAVDLTSLSTVDVRFAGGDDEITITAGKRLISSDAAIRVTGKTGGLTFAPIALNTIGTATVDTANVLGAAAITITGTGDKNAHRINNLNVNASSNADGTITVNGPVSLTGNLTATADVVTSTSNITVGGALIVNALDTLQLTASQIQGATVVFNVDSTDADAAGGTANLVGTAIVSQNAPAQLNGGEQNDEFLVDAGYTSTLNIAARAQSGVDRLQVAGTAVRISDVSLTSDGKADVNFTGIEQVQLNGAGTAKVATNVTILGDKAPTAVATADVLTVARTAATEFTLTLTLNGLPIVAPASLDILAVQLGNDIDTTTFTQTANGGPLPNGTTTITNTAGDDEVLVVGLGGQGATVVGSGTVAKTATATIDGKQLQLNNVRGLSLDKFTSVELQYAGATDELDVAAGTLAISGGAALVTTGKSNTQTQIQIAAANTTNLTINTAAAGDGADIVRLGATGAATTHNVTNFTLRTGIGGDSVEITGDNAFTDNLAITTGGNLTVSKNILAKNVTLETTDAATAGQDVLVRGGVTIEASETIVINAGDNLTARGATLKAGNTITLQIDANSADDEGAIADLNNTIVQAKNSTLTGNSQNDTFTLTNTATPLSINGKAPTNTSTGDTLIFDTKQELLVATAGSFNNVSYTDIEAIQVLNAKAVSFNGGNVDDRLVLTKSTKVAALPFQYQLDSLTPVTLEVPTVFSFAGLAKSDTLVVDLKTNGGVEIPASGINFDGGADADVGICVLGNGQTAIYTADNAATGKIVVNDRTITFANLETSSQVDITGMTRVDVTTSIANDTLEINEGLDATAGKSNMALIVSGPATPRVGLWKNATVNVLTDTVSGSDTVTITRAANAHANVNLTVDTGLGNDTLAVNGPMMFTGNLTLRTQTASIANNANLMASSVTIANTKTLTVGTATLLASNGQVRQLNSGSVVLNGALTVTATDRVLFTGAIDGPGSLAVNTPAETRFDRKLGETKAIDSLVTDKGGNVSFGETLVRTSTKQQFGETVRFDKQAMTFEGLGGTIQFDGTLDSLLADADLVVGGPNVDITFGGAVGSTKALRTLTINNAKNATANGAITAQRFEQKAGSGTTTLNGPVSATGSTAVTNFLEDGSFGQIRGGAVNLITDKIAINNNLSAPNSAVVLQAKNGVLQKSELSTRTINDGKVVLLEIKPGDEQNAMKSKLTTPQLYLSGSGDFALLGSQNQLTKDAIDPNIPTTTSNLFANLSSGKVEVFDASRLVLNFDAGNTNKAIITIGGNGTLNLFTNGDLTAEDTRTSDANIDPTTLPTLISVAGGTVTIIPGLQTKTNSGTTTVRYLNETVASRVTLGTSDANGLINNGKDTFFVRPMRGSELVVNGNAPLGTGDASQRPWDRLSPRFKNVDSPSLQSFGPGDGRYTFSGSRNFQPLSFTSIESLAGLSLEAFVVQTGPSTQQPGNTYAIRVQASQTSADLGNDKTKLAGAIRGNGVITNPFVVTPNRSSSTSSFRQPTITSALVDNDDTPDLIIAGGAGDAPLITIIRGSSFLGADKSIDLTLIGVSKDFKKDLIAQFYPFEESFRGGLQVSAGDFDNDGFAEIVVGAGDGGGPRVSVFSISNRQNDTNANVDVFNNAKIYTKNGQEFNFFPYESSFRGGVNVAAGDVNGDGFADIIAGAGNGGGPRVRVYSGADRNTTLADYFAFESSFRGGVLVAAGRFDGDTTADVMMAAGPGGGARIRVLGGSTSSSQLLTTTLADFFAYGPEFSLGDPLAIDQASTLTGRTFPGIGAIAFGSSTAGDGSRRSILVATPRGEEFQLFRFDPTPDGKAPNARTANVEDLILGVNPIEGVADLAQLRDGSSIGGFTTETLDGSI